MGDQVHLTLDHVGNKLSPGFVVGTVVGDGFTMNGTKVVFFIIRYVKLTHMGQQSYEVEISGKRGPIPEDYIHRIGEGMREYNRSLVIVNYVTYDGLIRNPVKATGRRVVVPTKPAPRSNDYWSGIQSGYRFTGQV